jgi:preprotein translocase subunit SecF
VVALWLTGQSINLMTLGGLALAVGILVDEATVAVENIHVQMERTDSVALAVWRGIDETAVPRLLAMLCILAVFIPSFLMEGAARALFVPLALAVGFAMIASYILSSTFVPVLSVWLLKGKHGTRATPGFARGVRPALWVVTTRPLGIVPVYLARLAALLRRFRNSAPRSSRRWTPGSSSSGSRPRPARASSRPRRSRRRRCGSSARRCGRWAGRSTSRSATSASCHPLPDQHRLPVDGRAGGVGHPGRAEAGPGRVEELKARLREKLPATCPRGRPRSGSARACRPTSPTAGRRDPPVVRAGRHRQRGDELRLADADRGEVSGDDLAKAINAAGKPPPGVNVDVRGQVTPMQELFSDLGKGLVAAVIVILLLLTAYFQSLRLAVIAVTSIPAVLCGVAAALLLTGSTLNLQSYMGSIMAVGVAVANSILLVTFAERARKSGLSSMDAAIAGVRGRVRPILMTSAAMIAGMMPMAIGLGEGGDQTAPLGRAVIGGLLASTAATLIILPSAFAWLMAWGGRRPLSLDPYDSTSDHFVPANEATT